MLLHFVAMRRVDCAASAGLEFGLRFELLLKTKTELGSFRILDLGSSPPGDRPVGRYPVAPGTDAPTR
jgi:hypothetical protein